MTKDEKQTQKGRRKLAEKVEERSYQNVANCCSYFTAYKTLPLGQKYPPAEESVLKNLAGHVLYYRTKNVGAELCMSQPFTIFKGPCTEFVSLRTTPLPNQYRATQFLTVFSFLFALFIYVVPQFPLFSFLPFIICWSAAPVFHSSHRFLRGGSIHLVRFHV